MAEKNIRQDWRQTGEKNEQIHTKLNFTEYTAALGRTNGKAASRVRKSYIEKSAALDDLFEYVGHE